MTTFVVTGADLHEAAAWALRATPSKPSAPVLAGLLLTAGDDLAITGYDWETRATATIPCTTTETGRLLVSGRLLAAVAKTVGRTTTVTITDEPTRGGQVQVNAGRAEWALPTLPVADYPNLPEGATPAGLVDAGPLRQALARVLPALHRGDGGASLEMLTGVHIESAGNQLQLVGTDRFRLAVATIPWKPHAPEQVVEALVPGALLDTAVRAVGAGQVTILEDDNSFGLATDTHLVTGRQLACEFINYRRFLDLAGDHRAVVDVAELGRAVDQALIAADTSDGTVPSVLLNFEDDEVRVSATGMLGRALGVAGAQLDGAPMLVKIQAPYLRDAMTGHGCDKVSLCFGADPNKPLAMLGDDPGYQHVLMPVRLSPQDRAAAA